MEERDDHVRVALIQASELLSEIAGKADAWETEQIVNGSIEVNVADELASLRTDLTVVARVLNGVIGILSTGD